MAITVVAVFAVLALTFSVGESAASLRFLPVSQDKGEAKFPLSEDVGDNLYDFCNTSLTPLVIHKFMITPDEIVKGKSVNLTAAGTLTKEITGGKVEGKITIDLIPIDLNYDLCTLLKSTDYKCPLAAKDYIISQSIDIPEIVPRGNAKGSVKVTDQDGTEIACINVHAQIK